MNNINVILADHPGLGRVRMCACGLVHIIIGPITFNLEPAAFLQMTTLLRNAAEQLTAIQKEHNTAVNEFGMQGQPRSRMTQ